jgi:hypothetical protein
VGIGEAHPLLRQGVYVRSGDSRFRIVGSDVTVSHIVGEDKNDVGSVLRLPLAVSETFRGSEQAHKAAKMPITESRRFKAAQLCMDGGTL